jgi:hypothetical protein
VSEKDVNHTLCRLLKPLNPVRVENALTTVGLPDINISSGWLECKNLKSYPKRETTPVRLHHPFTPEQKRWAEKRTAAGGKVWLVVKVANDWYIFLPPESYLVGELTKGEMKQKALAWWHFEPPQAELLKIFS